MEGVSAIDNQGEEDCCQELASIFKHEEGAWEEVASIAEQKEDMP